MKIHRRAARVPRAALIVGQRRVAPRCDPAPRDRPLPTSSWPPTAARTACRSAGHRARRRPGRLRQRRSSAILPDQGTAHPRARSEPHRSRQSHRLYLTGEGYDAITITAVTGDRLRPHVRRMWHLVCRYKVHAWWTISAKRFASPARDRVDRSADVGPGRRSPFMPCGPVSGSHDGESEMGAVAASEFNFAERDGTSNQAIADFAQFYVQQGMLVVYAHHGS